MAVHNRCTSTTLDMFGIDEEAADEFGYWFCWNVEYGYFWSKMINLNIGLSSRVYVPDETSFDGRGEQWVDGKLLVLNPREQEIRKLRK